MPNSQYAATAPRDVVCAPHCVPGGRMGPMIGKSTEATVLAGYFKRGGRSIRSKKPGRGMDPARFLLVTCAGVKAAIGSRDIWSGRLNGSLSKVCKNRQATDS